MNPSLRLALLLVPSGLILVLVAATPRASSSSASPLRVCRHRAADGELSIPLDQRKVEAGYVETAHGFKGGIKRAVADAQRTAGPYRDPGYRSGISACRKRGSRSVTLRQPLPPRFRGKTLYFLPVGTTRFRGPLPAGAEVFLTEFASVREAGIRAQEWGVPVSAAPAPLAERLAVQCAGTRVQVSADGRTLDIWEDRP